MVGADIGLCALYSLANATSVVAGTALIAMVCGDRRVGDLRRPRLCDHVRAGRRGGAGARRRGVFGARRANARLAADAVVLALGCRRSAGLRGPVPGPDDDVARSPGRVVRSVAIGAAGGDRRRQHAAGAGGRPVDAVPLPPGSRSADDRCRLPGAVRPGGRLRRGRRHAGRIGGGAARFPASTLRTAALPSASSSRSASS